MFTKVITTLNSQLSILNSQFSTETNSQLVTSASFRSEHHSQYSYTHHTMQ